MNHTPPPRWDLRNVYASLESPEFEAAMQSLRTMNADLENYLQTAVRPKNAHSPVPELAASASGLVQRLNRSLERSQTLRSYLWSFITTDASNALAARRYSEFEQLEVRLKQLQVLAEKWIGTLSASLEAICQADETLQAQRFYLEESIKRSKHLMSEAEETLAAELGLSGASAWTKLQGKVTSLLSVDFELDGRIQKLSMPALINLRNHADEDVRRRAYEAELTAWREVQEVLAAAMNGVKGSVNTVDRRRGRPDALHAALEISRIDPEILGAMNSAVEASLPDFRRYFHTKARRLGKEKLAWWDLFAPLGQSERIYSFVEAQAFVLEHFERFSPDLAAFARQAFEQNWIDAEQRVGKRAGAFCMGVPEVKQSRILANFDGSLDSVFTIAHELGHGFHNLCMYNAGRQPLQRVSPMTLNETASIMCETLAFEAVLAQASSPAEDLSILEIGLISDSQVVVDIYSRYLFEREVFERRAQAELSAGELNELMEAAQRQAYGDGLDERYLQPFMWTWKPHYYYPNLSFYNFPYTFGLLFGIGLYAVYQQRGAEFVPDYVQLLSNTGQVSPAVLAGRFGIDIRSQEFWQNSLDVIKKRIERYCSI